MRRRQWERERARREEEEENEKKHRKKERKNMDVATKAKLKRKSFKSWHQQTTHSHSYSHWMFNNTTHNTNITENIFKSYVKSDIYNGADIAYFSSSFSILLLNRHNHATEQPINLDSKCYTNFDQINH